MRIHRVRMQHVKGVQDVTVTFPDSGLTVIEGPNEVGKSTLLEALDRLLDPKLKSTSRAAAITALQPVGADVGPHVEAELSLGAVRVVFAKQWLRQPSTVLTILEPAREVLTGDDAASRMTRILDQGLDRSLLEALRCAQSGSLRGIELGDSDALSRALDAASGADLHADDAADLVSAAQQEYERYFTATGRPTGQLRAAIEAVNAATDSVVETQRALAEADQLIARRVEAAATLARAEADVSAAETECVAAREVAQRLEVQRARQSRAQEQLALVTVDLRRAEQDQRARAELVREAAERAATVQRAEADMARSEATVEQLARAEMTVQAMCEEVDERLADAETEAAAAQEAVGRSREQAETVEMTRRLSTAQQVADQLVKAQQLLAAEPVSQPTLRAIESVERDLAVASAGADAAATTLSLQALSERQTLTLNGDTVSLGADGEMSEHLVAHGAELVLGGVRLRIEPHPDAVRHAEERDSLRASLDQQLGAAGCEDVAQAQHRAGVREQAWREVARLEEQLSAALAGPSLDELSRAVAERTDLTTCAEEPADLDAVTALAARCGEGAREARVAAEHAHRKLAAHAADSMAARGQRDLARAHRQNALAELSRVDSELAQARAAVDDETIEQALSDHGEAVVVARGRVAESAAALAGAELGDPGPAQKQARLSQARAHLETARAEFHDVKGRLEVTAAEGRHEAHERAEQGLDDARRRYGSVERRARAARHLHTTLQRHRDQAHESYAAPYAREIERLGALVYGDSFGVTVDSRLVITHRDLDGVRVPFDQISGGAAEQLGILARLAVASMVDPEQCAPVVIDDALGFTDPERLKRIGQVVGGAGGQHAGQIIVLTCTPQRYDGIAGAHRVTLSA